MWPIRALDNPWLRGVCAGWTLSLCLDATVCSAECGTRDAVVCTPVQHRAAHRVSKSSFERTSCSPTPPAACRDLPPSTNRADHHERQFRWKSDTVAEGYIGSSKTQKLDVAKALTITSNDGSNRRSEEAETNSKIVKIENCSNIIIHF